MRRHLLLFGLAALLSAGAFSCSGGVDTKQPPADDDDVADDDDDAATTPTGTGTATPTPQPGLVGDPWTTTANPASDTCAFVLEFPYGNAGTKVIGITQTNGTVVFDVGMHLDPNVFVGDEPSGTLTGTNFTQTFSYCTYNGASTYKYAFNWTGAFDAGMTNFTSTLGLVVRLENGNHTATCQSHAFPAYGDCTSPGMSYSITGVKQ